MTPSVLKLVSDSNRMIKEQLELSGDVVDFLLASETLKQGIQDFLGGQSGYIQIIAAKYKCSPALKNTANEIISSMRREGRFNLDDFFNRLFVLRFPKALSSLEIGFRKLSQSHPTKVGIVEYGSRFAVFVKKLGLSLKGNYLKFVEGLTNSEVRVAMLRFPFHDLSYEMLISTAVGIENSVSISRPISQARTLMNCESWNKR